MSLPAPGPLLPGPMGAHGLWPDRLPDVIVAPESHPSWSHWGDTGMIDGPQRTEFTPMAGRMSRFRTPEDAERYNQLYDDLVDRIWTVPHEELDITTSFGTTRVRRSGTSDGEPLVLIHPTSGSSLGWHRLVPLLCERHPVYTPDTIGTAGRSVQTMPVETKTDLVTWLDEVLDGLALTRIHLVGYSEGGWIAALYASLAQSSSRLASLTLMEPAGAIARVPTPFLIEMIGRAAATLVARDKRQAIQKFNRWMNGDVVLTEDELDLVQFVFRTFRQQLPKPERLSDDQLRDIGVRTLLLLGAETKLYDPEEVAARAGELLSECEIQVYPHAGHGLAMQYPREVTARILRFIERG